MMTLASLADGQFLHISRFQPEHIPIGAQYRLADGGQIDILAPGIVQISPAVLPSYGLKHIVYSCGIHGNETAPIEICSDILDQIMSGKLKVRQRLLIIFGNLPAMNVAKRFVDENLNRLFCAEHANGPMNSERFRAAELERFVSAFFAVAADSEEKLHYDLHTAIRESKNEKFVVMPYLNDGRQHSAKQFGFLNACRQHSAKQFGFLNACGIKTFLMSSAPTTTFSYYSSTRHKARAFTVELGRVKPFGENDMARFAQAKDSLTKLITQDDYAPVVDPTSLEVYRVNQVIHRCQEDFVLHFDDDLPNFSQFQVGQLLASETGAQYVAQYNGEAIVFPNAKVAIGQRALLTVVPTTLTLLDE